MTGLVFALLLLAAQGINFFSLQQDIEIGSESARAAEQSLPLAPEAGLPQRYVSAIGRRVAQNHSIPALNYRFRIVNSESLNSAGFPGGAVYVNRGLLEIASNDSELAAILAHEVSHVALRHGTAQLSRQILVQAPIAIAAGLPASQVWRDEITKLGIGLGMDAPFLRYSRDQEVEACVMAVQLMAGGRYDPAALRSVLEKIAEAGASDAARTSAFAFSHPQAETVAPSILEAIDEYSSPARRPRQDADSDFRVFRSALLNLPAPAVESADAGGDAPSGMLANVYVHPMDYYRLGYPTGWQITKTGTDGAMIAPENGVESSSSGDDLTHGVMFDLFDIAVPEKSLTLEQATNRVIVFLRQRNPSLRIVPGAQTQTLVSDEPALRTVMIGRSADGAESEVAWVVTRLYYQSLFYMVFVAPEDEFPIYQPVFEEMIRSARLR